MKSLILVVAFSSFAAMAEAQDAQLVAVTATPSGDGVLTVPIGGLAAFSWAVLNYGVRQAVFSVEIEPTSTAAAIQIVLQCPTNPTTGQCQGGSHAYVLNPARS